MSILERKEEDNIIDSDGNECEIAKLLFVIFKDKYKYNNDLRKWYSLSLNEYENEYENDNENNDDITIINDIRNYLSEDLCNRFMIRSIYYCNMTIGTSNNNQREIYNKKALISGKISKKLKRNGDGYKSRILKELSYMLI
jgi:hypothetical protein